MPFLFVSLLPRRCFTPSQAFTDVFLDALDVARKGVLCSVQGSAIGDFDNDETRF